LQRDGYRADDTERCIILIMAQCRGVAYDCYDWPSSPRTIRVAHNYIQDHWQALADGDVIDVEFILGERPTKKTSEREPADLDAPPPQSKIFRRAIEQGEFEE
jgi:hypothetical protein